MNRDTEVRINCLRIKELQECLEKLGLKKTGRKADLQQRLLDLFVDSTALALAGQPPRDQWRIDQARRIVDEVYCQMTGLPLPPRGSSAGNSGSGGGSSTEALTHGGPVLGAALGAGAGGRQRNDAGPGPSSMTAALVGAAQKAAGGGPAGAGAAGLPAAAAAAAAAAARFNTALRCLCGPVSEQQRRRDMLQCQGSTCGVWQHPECIMQQLKPPAGASNGVIPGRAVRDVFLCEMCRWSRSDPFWEVVQGDLVAPAMLRKTGKQVQVGMSYQPQQALERSFSVLPSHLELCKRREGNYRLQVMCLLLDDPVQCRVHWPLHCDVKVNSSQYNVTSRSSNAKLGANQRDEPANVTVLCFSSKPNRLSVTCTDGRQFVIAVQLARKRSVSEVKQLMAPALTLEQAVARVKSQFHQDDDFETVNSGVSLKDPLTGTRMSIPARFRNTPGLVAFDLDAFLSVAERTRKWQCPHSMTNSWVQELQVDTYLQHVLGALKDAPDITEVEISPEGLWRPVGTLGPFLNAGDPYVPDRGPAGGPGCKAEPGVGGRPLGPGANGGTLVDSSDESEEDEMEELRRAARGVKQAAAEAKRKREASPDIIIIDDSSDEDDRSKAKPTAGSGARGGAPTSAAAYPLLPSAFRPPPAPALRTPSSQAPALAGTSAPAGGVGGGHRGPQQQRLPTTWLQGAHAADAGASNGHAAQGAHMQAANGGTRVGGGAVAGLGTMPSPTPRAPQPPPSGSVLNAHATVAGRGAPSGMPHNAAPGSPPPRLAIPPSPGMSQPASVPQPPPLYASSPSRQLPTANVQVPGVPLASHPPSGQVPTAAVGPRSPRSPTRPPPLSPSEVQQQQQQQQQAYPGSMAAPLFPTHFSQHQQQHQQRQQVQQQSSAYPQTAPAHGQSQYTLQHPTQHSMQHPMHHSQQQQHAQAPVSMSIQADQVASAVRASSAAAAASLPTAGPSSAYPPSSTAQGQGQGHYTMLHAPGPRFTAPGSPTPFPTSPSRPHVVPAAAPGLRSPTHMSLTTFPHTSTAQVAQAPPPPPFSASQPYMHGNGGQQPHAVPATVLASQGSGQPEPGSCQLGQQQQLQLPGQQPHQLGQQQHDAQQQPGQQQQEPRQQQATALAAPLPTPSYASEAPTPHVPAPAQTTQPPVPPSPLTSHPPAPPSLPQPQPLLPTQQPQSTPSSQTPSTGPRTSSPDTLANDLLQGDEDELLGLRITWPSMGSSQNLAGGGGLRHGAAIAAGVDTWVPMQGPPEPQAQPEGVVTGLGGDGGLKVDQDVIELLD